MVIFIWLSSITVSYLCDLSP